MIPGDAALAIIDVQDGFRGLGWGTRNNPRAEERIAELLQIARRLTVWSPNAAPAIEDPLVGSYAKVG